MIAPRRLLIAFIAWTVAAPAAGAAAQASTATISANVATLAKLTLSRSTVSFPDADPDTVPQVAATGGADHDYRQGPGATGDRGPADGAGVRRSAVGPQRHSRHEHHLDRHRQRIRRGDGQRGLRR